MSPPVSGRQWGKNPTWHDGILHGPAEFNLGCQRIVVQALKGRRNMCLRVQIVENSKVYLSMVPKEPDSSLLMWNFYGLHSSHLPHFFCSEQTKLLLPNNFSQGIPGSSINVQRFKRSPLGHSTSQAWNTNLKTSPVSPCSKWHTRKWNQSNPRNSAPLPLHRAALAPVTPHLEQGTAQEGKWPGLTAS